MAEESTMDMPRRRGCELRNVGCNASVLWMPCKHIVHARPRKKRSRGVPAWAAWLFWDVDPAKLDLDRDEGFILPRVLEFGGMAEVRWVLGRYGRDGIRAFLRDVGHPEISSRTLAFWRAALGAEKERWASPPDWRRKSFAPWPGC